MVTDTSYRYTDFMDVWGVWWVDVIDKGSGRGSNAGWAINYLGEVKQGICLCPWFVGFGQINIKVTHQNNFFGFQPNCIHQTNNFISPVSRFRRITIQKAYKDRRRLLQFYLKPHALRYGCRWTLLYPRRWFGGGSIEGSRPGAGCTECQALVLCCLARNWPASRGLGVCYSAGFCWGRSAYLILHANRPVHLALRCRESL